MRGPSTREGDSVSAARPPARVHLCPVCHNSIKTNPTKGYPWGEEGALPLCPEVSFVPLGLTKALITADSQSTQEVAWDAWRNAARAGPAPSLPVEHVGLHVCRVGGPHTALGPRGEDLLILLAALCLLVTGRFLADGQSWLRGGR